MTSPTTSTRPALFYVLLIFVVTVSAVAFAQPEARRFDQVAISPDGKRVAWIGPADGPAGNSGERAILGRGLYVRDLENANAAPLKINQKELANAELSQLAWSRDSRMLTFLAGPSGTQPQLYIANADAQGFRKLTNLTGDLADPAWSPDGKTIAFLFTENAPRAAGPLMPMTPETGVIDARIYEQRLTVIDVANGTIQTVSPADMYVYEFDWSPDGKQFALTAAPGAGDNNWYIAQLYVAPASGGPLKSIHKPPLQLAVPRWSPDGKNIAFIAGLMSDEGAIGGDIFVVPAAGGTARNVTPEIPASPSWLTWQSPDKILFAEHIDGDAGLGAVKLSSGEVKQLWRSAEVITAEGWGFQASVSADGMKSAVIRHSASQPPEIWAGAIGNWEQITHVNDEVRPDWGAIKSLHWTSDGMTIQGWLVYPTHFDPSKRYPMVVMIHGGPAAGVPSSWPGTFFSAYRLTKDGYFAFLPNPRGSYGWGEAFTRANVKDLGYGDLRDILSGVDAIVKTLPVDNDRIGITGWSYGGFMTMWAVTQTHRFHAAVSGAGLSNFQSYYGENDIDRWLIPYFGASVYDDPAVYARSSAINFVKNAKTPTLMLVGERDGECPAPQSREFWHALKELGVETELVIYAGEGHGIQQAEHRQDIQHRMKEWFDKYLKSDMAAAK